MKKLLLTASLMLGFCGLVRAEPFEVPSAQTDQQASIYYGGVKYASSSFSSDISTVAFSTTTYANDFGGVFYGVHFSSGACSDGDFVEVYDSTGANAAQNLRVPTWRLYNVYGSTQAGSVGGLACSGFSGVFGQNPVPIRVKYKMFFKPSSSGYNSIMLYYWKPE